MTIPSFYERNQRGFTLAEIAIVLSIVLLLLGGMLMGLSAQIDNRNRSETQALINDTVAALLGFAAANGRLPCPAIGGSKGNESTSGVVGASPCTNPWNGFVPGRALGLTQLDANGLLLDGWGNPIRYAVTTATSDAFTTTDGIRAQWLGPGGLTSDLRICSSGAGVTGAGTASADCPSSVRQSDSAVAVVYSLGKNSSSSAGGTGADESQNPNPRTTVVADRVFISHEPTAATAPGGEFDDIVAWLSPNILYNRMIAAGRLP